MLVLLAERAWLPKGMPILQYLIVSLCIVVLIYLTVVLKRPQPLISPAWYF